MRTLFVKTLAWMILTAIITTVLVAVLAGMAYSGDDKRQPPVGMLVTLQLNEARAAYEQGGVDALARTLERFRDVTGAESILTDGMGRDLLTGQDRSDLVERTRGGRARLLVFQPSRAAIARESADGRYRFFLLVGRSSWPQWFFHPRLHLVVLANVVLLCWIFASRLTTPVRQLQRAVEGFGRGELATRARSARRDELGELARTFDHMADRIQTLVSAERRLLADISHELRSPLARLNVALELARGSVAHDSEYLDRIQKEADRLNGMVGELLQVTRAEGDPQARRMADVDLVEVVASTVDDCRLEAAARQVRIELAAPPHPVKLRGDAQLLRRAVENVVRNAIRFEPENSAVQVCVDAGRVEVRDHGPGVPEEDRERIFDAFYRVGSDRSRESGGAGLGLSIARRAVEIHRGRIYAENVKPGLRVSIALPLT